MLIVRVVSANHPIKVRKKKDMMEARFDRQHVVEWKEFIVRRCAPSADGRTADKRLQLDKPAAPFGTTTN